MLLVTLEEKISKPNSIKSNFAACLSSPDRSFDPIGVIGPATASFVVDTASHTVLQFSEVNITLPLSRKEQNNPKVLSDSAV